MKQCRHVELAALIIYCSIFSQLAVKPISHGRVDYILWRGSVGMGKDIVYSFFIKLHSLVSQEYS
jgi:hypothetical protein